MSADKRDRWRWRWAAAGLTLAAALVIALPALADPADDEDLAASDPDYRAGKEALQRKDWNEALKRFGQAALRAPDNPDVENYLGPLSEQLRRHGYAPDEARAAALTLLPDILHYDRSMPAHYPNGRVMTDDVFSTRMTFMTHGQAMPQGVKPHDDLMAEFPFLGTPHP